MRAAAEPGRDMRAAVELMITNPQGERVRWTGQFYRLTGPPARRRLVLETPVDLRGVSITPWPPAHRERPTSFSAPLWPDRWWPEPVPEPRQALPARALPDDVGGG